MRREELIGRTIANRFRIKRVLGEGGMATVFVAEQDAEPREIALKILRPEMHADRTFAKRFEREARAAARVLHPNSVVIFDAGVEGNISYIAMELLRGDDLFTLLERHGALSPRAAATIVAEVCDALTVAHGLGIVHRDLKPENIMIVRAPSAPSAPDEARGPDSVALPPGSRIKVLDFGIAKLLDRQADVRSAADRLDPPTNHTAVTRAGTLIGTPAYMSPEQCALLPVDTRSDLYTCGVLLFQMVTGRLPFEGPSPLHIATKHLHEDAPALRAFLPGADPELEAILLKALAKRPADRHPSARNLAGALRKLLPTLPDVTYAGARRTADGATPTREVDLDPLSIDVSIDSAVSPAALASARTMVAEGLAGPPPSVLVRDNQPPRRPLVVLARHSASTPDDAPPPTPVLDPHPEVEPEPDDLASTLVRGTHDSSPDLDLARTMNASGAPAGGRQPTLQSPASPPRDAALPRAARISIADPPPNQAPALALHPTPAAPPLSTRPALAAPPTAPPVAPAAVIAAVAETAAVASPKPKPATRPAPPPGPAAFVAASPVPVSAHHSGHSMPLASVILSPELTAPPAPTASPTSLVVPPMPATAPSPAPTFGIPPSQAAPAPLLGRALGLGILIGVFVSAVLFALAYVLFSSR